MKVRTNKSAGNRKTADPLALSTLIAMTESKLFGFKCDVRDGTLAEREVERRIHTFFAVLDDAHIVVRDSSRGGKDKTIAELLQDILAYLSPIYREAEKELSTINILTDLFEFFTARKITLSLNKSDLTIKN